MTYIAVDEVKEDDKVEVDINMLKMLVMPVTVQSKDSRLTLDLRGENFPVYLCVSMGGPERDPAEGKIAMTTPVIATVTPYGSDGTRLATTMHNVDDKKRCFSTGGLWMHKAEHIVVEFAWDG